MGRQVKSILNVAITVLFVLLVSTSANSVAAQPAKGHGKIEKSTQVAFQDAMRKLWEDHIIWTRVFIISALADLPDKEAATQRLLQNQVDIGNAIKPYYGDAAGNQLTTLLKEHITVAAELVTAAKAGDKAKQDDANKRWLANADQIAAFLSKANPNNWPEPEMRMMMRDHLKLTTNEVVARLNKDWQADIAAYDQVHNQILLMADGLSAGIIRQFPDKFKGGS